MKTIGFIGGGRIAKILLRAWQQSQVKFNKIVVFDVSETALSNIKNLFPDISVTANMEEPIQTDLIILAVHPPIAIEILEKMKGKLRPQSVLLSLVPKISIEKTSSILEGFGNVARMNPSASTIVNKGVNPVSFSSTFDMNARKNLQNLFAPLGYMPEIADSKIEAYAVISAMGHTYFNFQLQKLKELAVTFGMEEGEAQKAISHMLWGTTETLFNSDLSYNEVADLVAVKPLAEVEETIKGFYDQYLTGIFSKIRS